MNKEIANKIKYLENTGKYEQLKNYTQHNNYSTYQHCIAVCETSLKLAETLHIKCNVEDLITAALLHDYYLYDWHEKDKSHSLHGFKHGKIAMQNAYNDYHINTKIQIAIKRHMFPLTPIPPTSKIGFLVTLADKICATKEVFKKNKLVPNME